MKTDFGMAMEKHLSERYAEYGIKTGDISPEQQEEWCNIAERGDKLFRALINQNTPYLDQKIVVYNRGIKRHEGEALIWYGGIEYEEDEEVFADMLRECYQNGVSIKDAFSSGLWVIVKI